MGTGIHQSYSGEGGVRSTNSLPHSDDEAEWLADVKRCTCVFCDAPAPSEAHHPKQGRHFLCIATCHACHDARVWNTVGMSEQDATNETIRRVVALRAGKPQPVSVQLRARQKSTRTPTKIVPRNL